MKKLLILLAVLIGLAFPAWIVISVILAPNELKGFIPEVSRLEVDSTSITLTIKHESKYLINGEEASFASIQHTIDSLASAGYVDSLIVVVVDPSVSVETTVEVMNLISETDRLIILKQ